MSFQILPSSPLIGVIYASLGVLFNSSIKYIIFTSNKKYYALTFLLVLFFYLAFSIYIAMLTLKISSIETTALQQSFILIYRSILLFLLSIRLSSIFTKYRKIAISLVVMVSLACICFMITNSTELILFYKCILENSENTCLFKEGFSSLQNINLGSDFFYSLTTTVLDISFFVVLVKKSLFIKNVRIFKNSKLIHQIVLYIIDISLSCLNTYRIISSGFSNFTTGLSTIWILGDSVKALILLEFGLDIKEMLESIRELNRRLLNITPLRRFTSHGDSNILIKDQEE